MTIDQIPSNYRIMTKDGKRFIVQEYRRSFPLGIQKWVTHTEFAYDCTCDRIFYTQQDALDFLENHLISKMPWKPVT